ncbi:probable pectinesterase 48 [Quercus lobata]|uniref:Pectinesterase n=1 Tax=Quercus lobata TaxID=97700 RepID=A0A7N2MJI3_QUELO|nr:probable pectinesterase 48 [Quercus lobata]
MAGKMVSCIAVHAALMTFYLLVSTFVIADDNTPVPGDSSQISNWFQNNVKPFQQRKGSLDSELVQAEEGVKIIKVNINGGGDFTTITDAIKSIPAGNTKRVIVHIGHGVYKEKIIIERTQPFVTLHGNPKSMPTLTYDGTAAKYGTVDSASLIVKSDYFVAANLIIQNSAPRPHGQSGAQASALRISGDKAAFFNCKIKGYQDTVCDDKGNHFFKDCYIEGTVDFIFGSGTSIYLNTQLYVLGQGNEASFITAHARDFPSETTGYSFIHCHISGTGHGTYLGRAWRARPRVVFSYTDMSGEVNPLGWSDNVHPERDSTVYFAEYKCTGPGADPAKRAKFAKQLSDAEAKPFLSLGFIKGSSWLLPRPNV